jgi:1,5-anhydro-D-fructose reductase (1,5-anhydro-D-mannitol-forming)
LPVRGQFCSSESDYKIAFMKPIRWGIIGCGDVTEVKSGPAFRKAAGSALVAVMRRDAAKAADYARRHGVPRWYDDAQRLIADPEVDAVYVATPPSMHESYAIGTAAAGKPCYVEKPMSRNAAEARRMARLFQSADLPLFVAYYRRALPRFVKARELMQTGRLGAIREVSYVYTDSQMSRPQDPIPWRLQPEHSGGGLFFDLGSHALDLLDFFFGPLTVVSAQSRGTAGHFEAEDQVQLAFTAGPVQGQARWDFVSEKSQDLYEIRGDKATLRFSCFGHEPLSTGDEQWEFQRPEHVQQPLIQTIVNILHGDKCSADWLPTGVTGLRTQEIMDRAVEGFYRTRADGFWRRA